jgi:hypothetical protein
MHVNLNDYTEFGKVKLMATIRVSKGQLQVEGKIPPGIRGELEDQHQRVTEDEAFLRSLPKVFSGTYVRAQFVA